jgi:hypothetical protein
MAMTQDTTTLPGLDAVLELAAIERDGWQERQVALRESGVPLNDMMIPENWPTLLAPGLRKIFHTRLRARDELFKRTQIFPIDTSQRAYEDYQGIGELGSEGWNEFERTGRVPYGGFEPGWKTRLEHREFAKGLVVQRKLLDDTMYPQSGIPTSINQRVEKLADSAAVHREKSAAAVFNYAFTDSGNDPEGYPVAGADGVGLVSTAHPASPTNPATQSNEFTLALNATNLKTVALAMRKFTDDKGELTAIHPDTLLVPPELEDDALVMINTAQVPGSGNNDVNTLRGRYKVVAWDYLTDSNAWFLLDSVLKSQHLVWLDRVLPEFQSTEDFDTLQAKYRGYYRFSRGFDAWQWIAGSNPS